MIKLIKSTFYKEARTKQLLVRFIRSAKQLSFGPECQSFEVNFAKWQERKHCVMLNSGSSANFAIIQTLLNLGYIRRGDLIGFSALTWSTNVMPIIELGLTPVPIDVELGTLNVSSQKLMAILEKYPLKAVFLTNLLGFCDDIDKIAEICAKHKIILIEDNCESMGTVYKKKKLGNYGLAGTFSFYVGHHMSTIEGGAVCTDNEEIATMARIVRAHGWDRNLSFVKQNEMRNKFKVNSTFYSRYTFYDLGYNFRPTEINGFIGNVQLKYADEIVKKHRDNFFEMAVPIYKLNDRYYPLRYDHIDFLSNFAVPVICRTQKIRDELVKKCEGRVEIRPIVGGDMTKQPFFGKYMPGFVKTLAASNAGLIHEQGLYFANNPDLTKKEKQEIIKIFTS
jgi:CDP-6-deoxy-D-xylo-4-hexulose-3-dehydrase